MMCVMIILAPHPAHSNSASCREWGWGRAGTRGGPLSLPLEVPSAPKAPKSWEQMSLMIVYAWGPVPLGVPSGSSGGTGFRAGWVSGGAGLVLESWALTSRCWAGQRSSAQDWGQAGQ